MFKKDQHGNTIFIEEFGQSEGDSTYSIFPGRVYSLEELRERSKSTYHLTFFGLFEDQHRGMCQFLEDCDSNHSNITGVPYHTLKFLKREVEHILRSYIKA